MPSELPAKHRSLSIFLAGISSQRKLAMLPPVAGSSPAAILWRRISSARVQKAVVAFTEHGGQKTVAGISHKYSQFLSTGTASAASRASRGRGFVFVSLELLSRRGLPVDIWKDWYGAHLCYFSIVAVPSLPLHVDIPI